MSIFACAARTYANACDTAIEMSLSGKCFAVWQSRNGCQTRYGWKSFDSMTADEWQTPEGHSTHATVTLVGIYRNGSKVR